MAEKPKGKMIYEVLIVLLIVALVGTILYPAKVWENEEELQGVCQTRMEAIHTMELSYISDPSTNSYSDSLEKVVDLVFGNHDNIAVMDTMINWDKLVISDDLKKLVLQVQFPEELGEYIMMKIVNGEPLGHLAEWDSLNLHLVKELHTMLGDSEFVSVSTVDSGVVWQALVGEDEFQNILQSPKVTRRIRTNTQNAVRRGQAIFATSGWSQFQPLFYQSLVDVITLAERSDVWQEDEEDLWEEVKREEWEADMDTLSSMIQDSLWQEYQQRFWENEKEVIWRKERNRLWKNEKNDWTENNTALWDRSLTQQWESERKKGWEENTLKNLSDSLALLFTAGKDSLWRVVVDSIKSEEYEQWKQDNRSDVEEMIHTSWENARRITWEDEKRQVWITEMEEDRDVLWSRIKEEIWNTERITLWQEEGVKLSRKTGALKRLDQSVHWAKVIGIERIEEIVNQLNLPDSKGMWKAIEKSNPDDGSSLYQLGIVGLFRDDLIASLGECPVAHQPYLIHVVDTSVIKRIDIRCPIVDTSDAIYALKIEPITRDTIEVDPVTGDTLKVEQMVNDTVQVVLKQTILQKLFGGGSIQSHGMIDDEGERSWEQKVR